MRSMTGFGVGDARLLDGRLVAEIRSVNQRFLDVRVRLPRDLAELSGLAEQMVRERAKRGRIELVVHVEGSGAAPVRLDTSRARAAFAALALLRDELAPGAELPLSLLGAVPDLFTPPAGSALDAVREALRLATGRALDGLDAMAAREGASIHADLTTRCEAVTRLVEGVRARTQSLRESVRCRLRERLERLLGGELGGLDPTRIEAEIALLADRSDVAEELTRLASHLEQLAVSLVSADAAPCQPIGRRIDFLLQEMLRESNTLSAKAQDVLVSQQVVEIKLELERLREQVQNIE